MSENIPKPAPPAELHWGISYLREDIQDLRQEFRGEIQEVRGEIQGLRQEVKQDVGELRHEVRRLDGRVDEVIKLLDNRFLWLMSTMVALAGAIIAVIRLG